MHESSYDKMRHFRQTHLDGREQESLLILDLGSMDVNGSYKDLFDGPGWTYLGMDMAPGKNVDIVLQNPYRWHEVRSKSVDVVISGQAFEHIRFFWMTMLEISRVLKPNGLCCIIAPSGGYEHRYPVDCWRFYPDGFAALAEFARLDLLEVTRQTEPDPKYTRDDSNRWKDTMMVCRKPQISLWNRLRESVRRRILLKALNSPF